MLKIFRPIRPVTAGMNGIVLLLLLPGIGTAAANVLIGICGAFLLFSFVMYIPVFRRMWKESGEER